MWKGGGHWRQRVDTPETLKEESAAAEGLGPRRNEIASLKRTEGT